MHQRAPRPPPSPSGPLCRALLERLQARQHRARAHRAEQRLLTRGDAGARAAHDAARQTDTGDRRTVRAVLWPRAVLDRVTAPRHDTASAAAPRSPRAVRASRSASGAGITSTPFSHSWRLSTSCKKYNSLQSPICLLYAAKADQQFRN